MKNYDLVLGDSLKGKNISVSEKKIAFLVPNMFNKVASGYDKNSAKLAAEAKQTETSATVTETPVVPQVAPAVQAPVPPAPPVVEESKPEVKTPELPPKPELAPVAPEEKKEEPQAPASTQPEAQPEAAVAVKEKRYVEKVTPMDVIFLRTNKLHANSAPKKLLISVVFKGKLVAHRNKSIEKAAALETAEKKEEAIASKAPEVDPTQEAIKKYLKLLDTRKEAIQTKQSAEKEMTELVNKFGITLDMVNAEINKNNNVEGQKVA